MSFGVTKTSMKTPSEYVCQSRRGKVECGKKCIQTNKTILKQKQNHKMEAYASGGCRYIYILGLP